MSRVQPPGWFASKPGDSAPARDRLLAGMAQAIRERGFRTTTVADVVRHARVSRRTFYEHFADRSDCFLALCDQLSDALMASIARVAASEAPWEQRVEAAIAAYLDLHAAEPVLTRSFLVEAPSVEGGAARIRDMHDRAARELQRIVDVSRAGVPGLLPLGFPAATMLVGGIIELVVAAQEHDLDLNALRPEIARVVTAMLGAG